MFYLSQDNKKVTTIQHCMMQYYAVNVYSGREILTRITVEKFLVGFSSARNSDVIVVHG